MASGPVLHFSIYHLLTCTMSFGDLEKHFGLRECSTLHSRKATVNGIRKDAFFYDMNESSIGKLLVEIDDLELVELWHTDDLRPDHLEKKLYVLLQGRTS
jgi:hypothetical protein